MDPQNSTNELNGKETPDQLLAHVGWRLSCVDYIKTFGWSFVALGLVYCGVVVTLRSIGWGLEALHWSGMLVVPVVAALVPLLVRRKKSPLLSAQTIDASTENQSLFLTWCSLKQESGFEDLVRQEAREKSQGVVPQHVVPIDPSLTLKRVATTALAIALLWGFYPVLDWSGKVEASTQIETAKEMLENERKATQLRLQQLREKKSEPDSHPATEEIDELSAQLKQAKPLEKEENREKLAKIQAGLGKKYLNLRSGALEKFLDRQGSQGTSSSDFAAAEQMKSWGDSLSRGDTQALENELEQVGEMAQQMASTDNPVEKADFEQQMKKKMSDLKKFAQKEVSSESLTAALDRAMEQLAQAKKEGLTKEALEGLEESLELAKEELQAMAKDAEAMEAINEAMKVVQMAKQMNEEGELDGQDCQACSSMADYQALYEQMMGNMAQSQAGEGESNMEGEGIGEGGEAPEDDSVATGFKREKANVKLVQGQMLMTMKTRGEGIKGEVLEQYQQQIQQVKQDVNDAISREQIPPGYHDRIKGYFDKLEQVDQ